MSEQNSYRDHSTTELRNAPFNYSIDPGFVHFRKIHSILYPGALKAINEMIRNLPELPERQKELQIDHIYNKVFCDVVETAGIKNIVEIVSTGKYGINQLVHAILFVEPCPEIYQDETKRLISKAKLEFETHLNIEIHYSKKHAKADTLKEVLYKGTGEKQRIALIATLGDVSNNTIILEPVIMGFPCIRTGDENLDNELMWRRYSHGENFIEDFKEFGKVSGVEMPKNHEPMKNISEAAFKMFLAELLGDTAFADWGGEKSDYYTSHLTLLPNRRVTGSFLLKGPACYNPMRLNALGKNNDQILRLFSEGADVMFVQHCHDIHADVKQTLRAFAVQPCGEKRYCFIDGRDSLRLLQAYDYYDKALELSQK